MTKTLESQIVEYASLNGFYKANNSSKGSLRLVARGIELRNGSPEKQYYNIIYFERINKEKTEIAGYKCAGKVESNSAFRGYSRTIEIPCETMIESNRLPLDQSEIYCSKHRKSL